MVHSWQVPTRCEIQFWIHWRTWPNVGAQIAGYPLYPKAEISRDADWQSETCDIWAWPIHPQSRSKATNLQRRPSLLCVQLQCLPIPIHMVTFSAVGCFNTPAMIAQVLQPARDAGLLPLFPLGSDFSEIEQRLIPALQILKLASSTELLALFARGIFSSSKDWDCLQRPGLARSSKPVEWLYSALVSGALRRRGKEF